MGIFGSPKVANTPPALGAVNIQQSAYGTPITLLYGTNRITGNLIWYGDFYATQVSQGGGGGGKGGSGGGGGSTTYNYFASFQIGLCEGPLSGVGIGQVWASKEIDSMAGFGGVVSNGELNNPPWGYLSSNHPDQAIGYNELAHADFASFALGSSDDIPQFSFEALGLLQGVNTANLDADAGLVMNDFLGRAGYPTGSIGDFSDASNYFKAMGFICSPIIDEQRPASDWLNELTESLNCDFVNSAGTLQLKPYADTVISGNGVTYTPNLTPWYSIDDDDYIVNGDEDPVHCVYPDIGDAYNQMPIEYCNRANQYNIETYTAEDAAHIDQYGIRTAPTMRAHHVTDPNVAQTMAYLYMWRGIYVQHGPTYSFKLPWNYFLLDPMDLISITDSKLGLVNVLVRITKIEEDEKTGVLAFTCESMPGDVAAPAQYSSQNAVRAMPDYNQDPGFVNPPIFFEAPLALVQSSDVEIDIAVSGASPIWGGCNVYVSTNGDSYTFLQQITGAARMGDLTAPLPTYTPAGNNIDTTSTLSIDMTESNGALSGDATQQDAADFNTLCYVDGELICYGEDTLTAANKYNITYLNRGCYGSTIGAHAAGSNFARIDASVIRYPVDQARVGQTIYFKFASFNLWGGGTEEISEVPAYNYTILGTALLTPLANPTNFTVSYVDNIARLSWTGISDIRSPIIYQIRKGSSFGSAQIIGDTITTDYLVYGTDTYWVTALFFTPFNVAVYSGSPLSISVTSPAIAQYLIDSIEEDPSWTGTVGGGATVVGSVIELVGTTNTNILTDTNVLPVPNILSFTSVAASGSYTIPTGNIIKTSDIVNAKVIINWTLTAVSLSSDVTAIVDVPTTPDITGDVSSTLVAAVPQVRVSQDGGSTWGAWQNWVPGVYPGNAWDFQILIYSLDPTVNAILSTFGYDVDVPLSPQTGTGTTSASVTTALSFTNQYNMVPYITLTIKNQQNGDYTVLGTVTASGFNVDVYNGASRVVRNISYTAIGY